MILTVGVNMYMLCTGELRRDTLNVPFSTRDLFVSCLTS